MDIVGSGTFGQVFMAIDMNVRPLCLYAIKAYKPHIKKEYGQHEIRQLKKLGTSPYISMLLAASTTPRGTVLVMPFYDHEPFEVRNAIHSSMFLYITWQHRSTSRVYRLWKYVHICNVYSERWPMCILRNLCTVMSSQVISFLTAHKRLVSLVTLDLHK
jgi:serine/threonine protein kinase